MIRPNAHTHPLVVYGAGDHGRVVAEAADNAGWRVIGFIDDARTDDSGLLWPLLDADDQQLDGAVYVVAIGDNTARRRACRGLHEAGHTLASIVHPGAFVSESATLHGGVFVGPGAVVHVGATLHPGVIINSAAVVEHDCHVGEYAHIAPGAALGGNVTIGAATLVGLNSTVLPRCAVGRDCTIGAGAVVTRSVNNGKTVVGVPATELA